MRTLSRTAVPFAAAAFISLALALPAFAALDIRYEGETSSPSHNRVFASVLKKDSGRRFLRYIALRTTLTCEDATTTRLTVLIGRGRLGEDGSFAREINDPETGAYLRVDGTIGFRHGSGTWLFNQARLTEDGTDAQLCTSGELTWSVERTDAQGVQPTVDIPGGDGLRKVGVSDGDHEVVKPIEP
jgi:hypothetical protein